MKRLFSILLLCLSVCCGLNAATYTTVAVGAYNDPATWDCSCVPTNADHVIIVHDVTVSVTSRSLDMTILPGAKVNTTAPLNVNGSLSIKNGGQMMNGSDLTIVENYDLSGVHTGSGVIRLLGTTISGTGIMSNSNSLELRINNKVIPAGSLLDFTSLRVKFRNNITVNNYGALKMRLMASNGGISFHNRAGATLEFKGFYTGFKLFAEYPGNSVIYSAVGTTGQLVYKSQNGYDNLFITGSGTHITRRLADDITVLGELTIDDISLQLSNAGVVKNITMVGDWNNLGAVILPGGGMVDFTGSGNTIRHHADLETFGFVAFSGHTILDSDIQVDRELQLNDSLEMAGQLIDMIGDWISAPGSTLLDGDGIVRFSGTSDSNIDGNPQFGNVTIEKTIGSSAIAASGSMSIWKTLLMKSGDLVTNDRVFIRSNEAATGRIGKQTGGNIVGDMRIQRFMNFPQNAWHNICSPVQNSTIEQWNYDFITTGYTGAQYPFFYFNNITRYDEGVAGHKDEGFYNVSNATDMLAAGEGVRAYIAAGYNLLDVKGQVFSGPLTYSIDYTPTAGGVDFDGWNLLANPYASTIDWDSPAGWTRTGIRDAVYIWNADADNYASYIGGVGTNGGSRYIPSSQSFWVKSDAATDVLQINEDAKVTNEATYRRDAAPDDLLKLTVTTINGKYDEVIFRTNERATTDLDRLVDALEFASPNKEVPSIALTTTDGHDCSIFSIDDFDSDLQIPIALHIGVSGAVRINAEGVANYADLDLAIFDSETGEHHSIRDNDRISFVLDADDYTDRFFLVRGFRGEQSDDVAEENAALTLTADDGSTTTINILFAEGATTDFDQGMDVLSSDEAGQLGFSLRSDDGLPLSTYATAKGADLSIPMVIDVATDGLYSFSMDWMDIDADEYEIGLYDTNGHIERPLDAHGLSIPLEAGTTGDRFFLVVRHVQQGLPISYRESAIIEGSYPNGVKTQVRILRTPNSTMDYDEASDVLAETFSHYRLPTLTLLTRDEMRCSVLDIPMREVDIEIPLTVHMPEAGELVLHNLGLPSSPDEDFILSLYDAKTGAFHSFQFGERVIVYLDEGDHLNRFSLVMKPAEKSLETSAQDIKIFGYEGVLTILNPGPATQVDIRVYDINGRLVDLATNQYLEEQILTEVRDATGVLIVELYDRNSGRVTVKKLSMD